MSAFRRREIAEQLARVGVARALRGLQVEAPRFLLHQPDFLAHALDAEIADQPIGPAVIEPGDVLAPDDGNGLAEAALESLDQTAAMRVFLRGHAVEDLGALRVLRAKALCVGRIDAAVFFFRRDCQRQNLRLGQIGKTLAVAEAWNHARELDWNRSNV